MNDSHHLALLATGTQVPVREAAHALLLLGRLLEAPEPEGDRALVLRLREACLTDHPVAPESARGFSERGLADDAGVLLPAVREVVRAALRGEGRNLHLVSPYVRPWDRVVSDMLVCQQVISNALPPDQAAALLNGPTLAGDPHPRPASWVRSVLRGQFRDGEPPAPGSN